MKRGRDVVLKTAFVLMITILGLLPTMKSDTLIAVACVVYFFAALIFILG